MHVIFRMYIHTDENIHTGIGICTNLCYIEARCWLGPHHVHVHTNRQTHTHRYWKYAQICATLRLDAA